MSRDACIVINNIYDGSDGNEQHYCHHPKRIQNWWGSSDVIVFVFVCVLGFVFGALAIMMLLDTHSYIGRRLNEMNILG